MNDHETTQLRDRLDRLADHMTPQLDVVAQVRDARDLHRRKRRGRLALLAVATATAAVAVGAVVTVDVFSADRSVHVAHPGAPTPTDTPTTAVPTTPAPTTSAPTTSAPTTTAPPTAAATSPAASEGEGTGPWPEEADLHGGGVFYGVFVAVAPWDQNASVVPLAEDLWSLHYNAAIGQVCASAPDGSPLPFDREPSPETVAVYFDTEPAAQQFVAAYEARFGRKVFGVYAARPFCL